MGLGSSLLVAGMKTSKSARSKHTIDAVLFSAVYLNSHLI
jgi:hypothetical protein